LRQPQKIFVGVLERGSEKATSNKKCIYKFDGAEKEVNFTDTKTFETMGLF